jgi:hypothetical protein
MIALRPAPRQRRNLPAPVLLEKLPRNLAELQSTSHFSEPRAVGLLGTGDRPEQRVLGEAVVAREVTVLEVDVSNVGDKFRKVGQTFSDGGFTLYSDEEVAFGGDGSAPWPLEYFLLAFGF